MKFNEITHIIMADVYENDALGKYDIKFHNMKVTWKGIDYQYHSSGLCRQVYISPDQKFVLKIPIEHSDNIGVYTQNEIAIFGWKYLTWSIKHNLLEFLAYKQCPKKFKKWFAKTELLDNCWLKQEFVQVERVSGFGPDIREIGRKSNGQICLFDYDPIINGECYTSPFRSESFEEVVFNEFKYQQVIDCLKKI